MHVAQIVTRGDVLGGAQAHVRDLCVGLRAKGHRVTVLAGGQGTFTEELDRLRIPRIDLRHLRRSADPRRDAAALMELVRVLRNLRPDLVATHTAKAGMVGRAAARIAGIPAVFTPHGWSIGDRLSARQGFVFRQLERLAAHVTGRIVNVCEYERELALRHRVAGPEKMAVVYNGLPDLADGALAAPEKQPPRIATIARMTAPKDHATLLRALAGLQDRAWSLDLIGGGPDEPSVRQLAESLGLAGRVRFRGFHNDVTGFLADAQMLVLASRSEAFPYVILEAMRAGLPVVASQVGGIAEAVVHGETGLLAPACDPEALRDRLALLIGNPELRQRMGAAGRRRFLERFTIDRMFAATLRIYDEVLLEKRARGASGGTAISPRSAA